MFLRRTKSDYGRLVPKPTAEVDESYLEEHLDDAIPIQDQLDGIAVKIQLKELYNNVLKDELEESKAGATSVFKELHAETTKLRLELQEAYNSEKMAVQKALRSHRDFQLAMTDRTPMVAIPWLDDKVYDISKSLNVYSRNLIEKKKKLESAERLVEQIERWPRPGTLPWEITAISKFHAYESRIEHVRVKLETANILFCKYSEIAIVLKRERRKYQPIIATIDDQLRIFSKELAELQKTLQDAVGFRDNAMRNFMLTQKEATENRRRRKIQMVKMKTAVRRVLESSANMMVATAAAAAGKDKHGHRDYDERRSTVADSTLVLGVFAELIKYKRAEIEKFQDRASRLVETMRVPDLTFIPIRFQSVMSLGERLQLELLSKEDLLHALIHQKAQLNILLAHFTYTGHSVAKDFSTRQEKYLEGIEGTKAETRKYADQQEEIGRTVVKIRVGSLRILEQLENRGKVAHRLHPDIFTTLKQIAQKLKQLVDRNNELKSICGRGEAGRNYAVYVKETSVPPRLLRVADSAAEESADSEADDGVVDSKVASRLQMKARSLRFIHNAQIRRGFR